MDIKVGSRYNFNWDNAQSTVIVVAKCKDFVRVVKAGDRYSEEKEIPTSEFKDSANLLYEFNQSQDTLISFVVSRDPVYYRQMVIDLDKKVAHDMATMSDMAFRIKYLL